VGESGCRELPVEGGAIDAEPSSDSGLWDPGADEAACFGDTDALALALALAFADEGEFELGEGAEEVEHEPADGVVGVAAVGLLLFDELDRCALGCDLVDDVTQVTEGAGEPVHRCDSDGVAVADVADAVELAGEVLIDRAHPN